MKEMLQQYAAYNAWANKRLMDCAGALNEEQLRQPVNSSFESIYHTFMHLWDAESGWWQRLKLEENVQMPRETFTGTTAGLFEKLQQQSAQWKAWVDNATELALQHEFIYQNTKREQFKQPVWQMLLHLFNHASYHRGQLITLLRQAGQHQIPGTDFIAFTRQKRS